VAFTPLGERMKQVAFPLILCGPILRRVEPNEVTVWVALKEARTVLLTVSEVTGTGPVEVAAGSRATVALGERLHVVAVTAGPLGAAKLEPGKNYAYDLDFGGGTTLTSAGVVDPVGATTSTPLGYGNDKLPSFSLPPHDLEKVRLLHGSCRLPHAIGTDALPTVDLLIATAAALPSAVDFARRRPHQLFLTGDQIYADDVAEILLAMLTDAGDALLGCSEQLPGTDKTPAELPPGQRGKTVVDVAKFTSEHPDSHLLGLGEFYAMYLFAWSNTPWSAEWPSGGPVEERRGLIRFRANLLLVRRALANVPTYMIFDDHEVTDDWYLNRRWCAEGAAATEQGGALATPLARRVVRNGLLAYATFQAWGNTPAQFWASGTTGQPGRELLEAAAAWSAAKADPVAGQSAAATLDQRLGVPLHALKATEAELLREPGELRWDFRVALSGCSYEVIFLDTRTRRTYPKVG